MSAATRFSRTTVRHIGERKGATPIVALTAYSAPMAQIMDEHCDLILVGDSLGMVLYGMPTTLGVTLDMMIQHGLAVMRGSRKACVIVDLPFGTYQQSPEQAFGTAARIMAETGCGGVKLEGGAEMAPTIEFLARRGVPVLAHVGLMPQAVHGQGGFRVQGRAEAESAKVRADAAAVDHAGAFAVVVEGIVESLGRELTESLSIPTIGIGASPACDGQILVTDDLIGLFSQFKPKFVTRYAEVGTTVDRAIATYAEDVKARRFPAAENLFT